jgi:hypothetical protein
MSPRNRLAFSIACFALAVLASCGSSSSGIVPPPSGGFTNSNLKGTYIFSFSGKDTSEAIPKFFTMVGTFTAGGNGGISSGMIDINDWYNSSPVEVGVGGSSGYSITADGRGRGTLITNSAGTIGIDFVLTSSSHGMIIRFDGSGTGSGTLDLQDSAVGQANLTSYAFSLSGVDVINGNPLSSVGAFSLNGTTTINAGLEDFNADGSSSGLGNLTLTGSLTLGTGAPGKAILTNNSGNGIYGSLQFDVWVIDATHLKLIETDGVAILEGDAFTLQTALASGQQQLVYTMAGLDNSNLLFSAGGYMSYDGSSAVGPNGLQDMNDSGSAANIQHSLNISGTLTTAGGGRYILVMSGFYNGVNGGADTYSFVGYPFSVGGNVGILLMENDGAGVTAGTALVQSAQTFAPAEGYCLNLTGVNAGGEVDDIAEFTANSAGKLSDGTIDENDVNAPNGQVLAFNQGLGPGGTYTLDSPATGRGVLSYPNTDLTYNGSLSLQVYVANSSTVIFIDTDSTQVGVGAFQLQNASASQAGVAGTQAHMSMLRATRGGLARGGDKSSSGFAMSRGRR